MSAKLTLSSDQKASWLKSKHFSRGIKAAAATLAILYLVTGSEIAADYAGSPQVVNADLGTRVTKTVHLIVPPSRLNRSGFAGGSNS